MTNIKNTTKKAQHFKRAYEHATKEATSLFKIYKSFSEKKQRAFEYCERLKATLNGYGARFCGSNCDIFTYGFIYEQNGVKYLAYITPQNDYCIEL